MLLVVIKLRAVHSTSRTRISGGIHVRKCSPPPPLTHGNPSIPKKLYRTWARKHTSHKKNVTASIQSTNTNHKIKKNNRKTRNLLKIRLSIDIYLNWININNLNTKRTIYVEQKNIIMVYYYYSNFLFKAEYKITIIHNVFSTISCLLVCTTVPSTNHTI